jgi:hypothetical protein
VATPEAFDVLIRVPSAGIDTIGQALAAWDPAAQPRAVIQIEDNRTYREDLTIDLGTATLVLQAANFRRPALQGDLAVTGAADQARLALNGLLVAGQVRVRGGLEELRIVHCTLVPGRALDEDGRPLEAEEPSVVVAPGSQRLRLCVGHGITGPLRLPPDMAGLAVYDSIVDSPSRGGRAGRTPAVVSGNLAAPLTLTAPSPALRVTIAGEGPHRAVLPEAPQTLAAARDQLQAAIRAAHPSPAFAAARVVTVPGVNRLILLPGVAGELAVDPDGDDPTASELRLDRAAARPLQALVGGRLAPFPVLRSATPRLRVLGDGVSATAQLASAPASLAQARDRLQTAIRAADPALAATLVASTDDQLVVLPGPADLALVVGADPGDPTTVEDLGLDSDRPAIAGDAAGGRPGPPTTLQRVTVFGAVHVRELTVASEAVFTAPVVAERRQAGCARFSYLPDGSRSPRRYRCQPDLALEGVTGPRAAVVAARVQPAFTSTHYGDPGYAQLALTVADELRAGAEDGSEMGAFSSLHQPQREANLRLRLEEYLPVGLEPGFIFLT